MYSQMMLAILVQGDVMAVCWLRDVASVLQIRSLASGTLLKSIPLPGLGSVRSISGRRSQTELFFSYTDFTDPGSIYRQVYVRQLALCSKICSATTEKFWYCFTDECDGNAALPFYRRSCAI